MKILFAPISALLLFSSCTPSNVLSKDFDFTALVGSKYREKLFLIKQQEGDIAQKEIVLDFGRDGMIRQAGFLSENCIFVLYNVFNVPAEGFFVKTYDITSREWTTIFSYESDFGHIFLMDIDAQSMYYQFGPNRNNILLSFDFISKEEKEIKAFPHDEEIVDIKTNAVQNTVIVNTNKDKFYILDKTSGRILHSGDGILYDNKKNSHILLLYKNDKLFTFNLETKEEKEILFPEDGAYHFSYAIPNPNDKNSYALCYTKKIPFLMADILFGKGHFKEYYHCWYIDILYAEKRKKEIMIKGILQESEVLFAVAP